MRTSTLLLAVVLVVSSTPLMFAQVFTKVPSENSGVTIGNYITESDSFNILLDFYSYNGGGVAAADVNNDGLADLFFTTTQQGSRLYINNGGMKFTDETIDRGINVDKETIATGVMGCDITGDGWADFIVCRRYARPLVYVNDGSGNFTEEGLQRGFTIDGQLTQAVPFDYDRDGDLDVFFVMNGEPRRKGYVNKGGPDRLFQNNGSGVFTDVSKTAGIRDEGYGLSAVVLDANNDGWPDVFVANDFEARDNLWINQRNGTFMNVSDSAFQSMSWASMGSDAMDLNNDGWMDIVSVDMYPRDHVRRMTQIGNMSIYGPFFDSLQRVQNAVHVNMGTGNFMNTNYASGIAASDWSWSVLLNDFDLDGHPDVYITNGIKRDIGDQDFSYSLDNTSDTALYRLTQLMPRTRLQNYAFSATSNLDFADVSKEWGLADTVISNGAAAVDLDGDGDLDLVVNNTDSVAFIYENQTIAKSGSQHNWIQLKFEGRANNVCGIGSKIEVYTNNRCITRERYVARGYQSSSWSAFEIIGLGSARSIDSIVVVWPDGKHSLTMHPAINATLTVTASDATSPSNTNNKISAWLEPLPNTTIAYKNRENRYDDFKRERLIPFRYSRLGPAMVVGDVNGDGLDDIVFSGPKYSATQLFVQDNNGMFQPKPNSGLGDEDEAEDLDLALADFDGDGDLDVYVVTGGSEFTPDESSYVDRYYESDGGSFVQRPELIPSRLQNGTCVAVGDVNNDGRLDLFVGAHAIAGSYPVSDTSVLLLGTATGLVEAPVSMQGSIRSLQLVRDAEFVDINSDGFLDLVVASEWSNVQVLINEAVSSQTSKTSNTTNGANRIFVDRTDDYGISDREGMWQYIRIADVNGDGLSDIVAGNVGTNCRYVPNSNAPIVMYSADFDDNGSIDPLIFFTDELAQNVLRPTRDRMTITQHIPSATRSFNTYMDYARADISNVLSNDQIQSATKHIVREFRSGVFVNNGSDFDFEPLPILAQAAPVYGVEFLDVDADGKPELIISGNNREADPAQIGIDGSIGLVMKTESAGGSKLEFAPVLANKSGFVVPGTSRGISTVARADGSTMIVVAINGGYPRCFSVVRR